MRRTLSVMVFVLLMFGSSARASIISFGTDPFAGTTALTTPGRQIIANELFINFDPALDTFVFDPDVFGINALGFANDIIANIPATGVNVVVLRTLDNDANPATPFGAGNAANLIAEQITASGAGFFIYFNSGLNLPRLVFSTDLGDNTADLKILARLLNLSGQPDGLAAFTAADFVIDQVPEPATLLLMTVGGVLGAHRYSRRRRRH